MTEALSSLPKDMSTQAICFGLTRPIPPTLANKTGLHSILAKDNAGTSTGSDGLPGLASYTYGKELTGDEVAVIGMSCKVAGADDLEEFWNVLCKAESQHTEIKDDFRFNFKTAFRGEGDAKRKWFGNFITDADAFDHKFWRKSPREAASTDPQQRLMMSVALQAVIQAGYFHASTLEDHHVGCYLGIGNVDYEENINCHEPTAFMATGNLRSFIAGKISHALGWTGPALTIDTACSSSGVAVHQACKAILSGECTAALAGGAAIMTSPRMFQDLAAASFLSPTGPCKSFDVNADGYCRGDGVGAVFLKKMSTAIEDGDQIFGVIAGTGVYQNRNFTAITVPNAQSLSSLFRDVAEKASLKPDDITYVEAHGTGTQIGDPAEFDGVRRALGGPGRSSVLSIGSVKSVVGHTEGAAGIISIIKVLLMMNEGAIPAQANFQTINPAIRYKSDEQIEVAARHKRWDAPIRAALINSYGASGSNASMVLTQAPQTTGKLVESTDTDCSYPFWFCGLDERSVQAYVTKFLGFLMTEGLSTKNRSLANLSFNVARQTNRWLPRALIFSALSMENLLVNLSSYLGGQPTAPAGTRTVIHPQTRPVVLCFGGQISNFIGLDREIFDRIRLLRKVLEDVDAVCQSLGEGSIFPHIFQQEPIQDTHKLQLALFAIQYSAAKCWMDCGLQISAVVGHSFGELTALCVSGVLTVNHAVQLVARRSRVVRDSWGVEKGVMCAVEGSVTDVTKILKMSNGLHTDEPAASIACFNGPTSFTIAGSARSVAAFEESASEHTECSLKLKRLNVTNAFHSTLVQPLTSKLELVMEGLEFREPEIPIERATETACGTTFSTNFVADHLRNPVYFDHAVHRLAQRFPSAVWLEAGSNSTITSMAKRALGPSTEGHFLAMKLTGKGSWDHLADTTMSLWKQGVNIPFWAHHAIQTIDYTPLILPPYQFEKISHWLGRKLPVESNAATSINGSISDEQRHGLWSLIAYQNSAKTHVRFAVHTSSLEFGELVADARSANQPLAAGIGLVVHIVIAAHLSLYPQTSQQDLQPEVWEYQSNSSLIADKGKTYWLESKLTDVGMSVWKWQLLDATSGIAVPPLAAGSLLLNTGDSLVPRDAFSSFERVISHRRCKQLLDLQDADESIQGRSIYRMLDPFVQYGGHYRSLRKVTSQGSESAGRFSFDVQNHKTADVFVAECFCQISALYLNSMIAPDDAEPWKPVGVDRWNKSPKRPTNIGDITLWDVFAVHQQLSDSEWIADVFAFDASSGTLIEAIVGLHFRRTLESFSQSGPKLATEAIKELSPVARKVVQQSPSDVSTTTEPTQSNVGGRTIDLLAELSGLDASDIQGGTELPDIGIDSLMSMELARDIEKLFSCSLNIADMNEVTNVQSLIVFIEKTLGITNDKSTGPALPVDNSQDSGSTAFTPSNSTDVPEDGQLHLPHSAVLETFQDASGLTDDYILKHGFANYATAVMPKQTELCVVHILDAFDQLDVSMRALSFGQNLRRVPHHPRHQRFVDFIYENILVNSGLIKFEGKDMVRTEAPLPEKSAKTLFDELLEEAPIHSYDHRLTYLAGIRLAEVFSNTCDGIQLLFSSSEGKENVTGMYSQSPINVVWIKQLEDLLRNLVQRLPDHGEPLKIFEMGAGTGGTTAKVVAILAALDVPVEYTVTDISPSLVAAARKRFKGLPFMKYQVHDIGKPPSPNLLQSQHIVLATNCVHATPDLVHSTGNIRQLLRPDGFLLMLEMTELIPWIDLVFGTLEGWWLFDDGREHALMLPEQWKKTLQSVGYGTVEWTSGERPESNIQRLIIALAS